MTVFSHYAILRHYSISIPYVSRDFFKYYHTKIRGTAINKSTPEGVLFQDLFPYLFYNKAQLSPFLI